MTLPDGLPLPRRYWAVLCILAGTFLGNLDSAIANVALPTIADSLSATPAATVWVVTSYQLAVAVCLLPVSAIGEIFGFRRIYCVGMAIFTLGSLACTLAPTLSTLVEARILQGVGGACTSSLGIAMMRYTYPKALIGRAVALFGLVVAISSAIGPSVAAGILSIASWRWLFAINVPLLLVALAIGVRALPVSDRNPRPLDWVGTVLTGLFFALFIIGLDAVGSPDSSHLAIVEVLGSLVVAGAVFAHQRRRHHPMVPIDLLRIPMFALSTITSICSYAAQGMAYVSLPFLLENGLGRSEVQTGLVLTPWPLIIVIVAPLAGRLSDRYSAGVLCSIGLALMASGLALLAFMPADPSNLDIVWRATLCGAGFGFFQTPNNRVLMLSGPVTRSGAAAGAMASARLLGSSSGAALVAVIFQVSGTGGGRSALIGACLFALVGIAVSSARLFDRGPAAPA